MDVKLWSSGEQLAGTVVATVGVYVFALVAVRLVGRRTTAQISAYDALVTIALGTTLATTALPDDPAVVDGMAVLATLLALQFVIGVVRRRFKTVQRLTSFAPRVVVRDGQFRDDRDSLSPQLTHEEVRSELRRLGVSSTDGVTVMVIEPSGQFSVLTRGEPAGDVWDVD